MHMNTDDDIPVIDFVVSEVNASRQLGAVIPIKIEAVMAAYNGNGEDDVEAAWSDLVQAINAHLASVARVDTWVDEMGGAGRIVKAVQAADRRDGESSPAAATKPSKNWYIVLWTGLVGQQQLNQSYVLAVSISEAASSVAASSPEIEVIGAMAA